MIRVTGSVRLKTCLINSNCIFNINIWQLAKPSCENIYTNPLESGLHCVISALLNGESGQSWGAAQPVIGFAEKTASSWSHAHSLTQSMTAIHKHTHTHTHRHVSADILWNSKMRIIREQQNLNIKLFSVAVLYIATTACLIWEFCTLIGLLDTTPTGICGSGWN